MLSLRRLLIVVPASVLMALALPGSAFGQATRTWVSGVGDDANPCSRFAPCRTFAGAISKTAAGGEINVLDPGGFGGVTITKSIAIKAHGPTAGVLVAGTNAIVINAAATDKVVLQGLDINGIGVGAPTSLVGIKVLSARMVFIRNVEVFRFQVGISNVPSSANTHVVVSNSHIHDNTIGTFNAPGAVGATTPTMTLRNNDFNDNRCGAVSASRGANAATPNGNVDCGVAVGGAINNATTVSAFRNGFNDNNLAVFARGPLATFELGSNDVTGNITGLWREDSGTLRSFGNNHVSNNTQSMAPNSAATMTRKRVRRRAG
jgi:hypothetical protein